MEVAKITGLDGIEYDFPFAVQHRVRAVGQGDCPAGEHESHVGKVQRLSRAFTFGDELHGLPLAEGLVLHFAYLKDQEPAATQAFVAAFAGWSRDYNNLVGHSEMHYIGDPAPQQIIWKFA